MTLNIDPQLSEETIPSPDKAVSSAVANPARREKAGQDNEHIPELHKKILL
ncbi:MAG: hypothetical protein Q7U51_15110 [Methanoregula sp.]|nr:hypothetical protein [Methanoregula sp.]